MKIDRAACSTIVAVAVAGFALAAASPAMAQFGGLFDPPPRPPSSVPGRPAPPPPQPQQAQPQLLPPGPPPGRPPSIQSEDLPPPGAARPGANPVTTLPPAPGQQPGQRPGTAVANTPASAPPPREDVVTPPPPARVTNPTAVFSGLDKITGRITAFDAAIGETVQFGALQVTARACYSRPPTETPLTDGFVEVDEVTLQGEVRRIFTGWMFAASPGLHAVEHPIYDVWLTECKGGAQAVAEAPPAAPATPPRQGATQQRQTPQQRQPAGQQPRQALPGPGGAPLQPGVFR